MQRGLDRLMNIHVVICHRTHNLIRLTPPPVLPIVAFWGQVLDMRVTAVFPYPSLPRPTAGLWAVMLSNAASGPLSSLSFICHPRISQNGLFHILACSIVWLACLFPRFVYTVRIFLKAVPGLYLLKVSRRSSATDKYAKWYLCFQNINHTLKRSLTWKGPLGSPVPELLLMSIRKTFC